MNEIEELCERLRKAFDAESVPDKNIALRKAFDALTAQAALLKRAGQHIEDMTALLAEADDRVATAQATAERLRVLLRDISNWMVCWDIATKDDLGESVPGYLARIDAEIGETTDE